MAGDREGARNEAAARGRRTPYEHVFAEGGFESERFPAIAAAAAQAGADVVDPAQFLGLSAARDLVLEMLPESPAPGVWTSGGGPEDAPGARSAQEQVGKLLFHAFHFWTFGRRLYVLETALARSLVDSPPSVGAWELTAPHPAGYLQLPRNLFWSRVEPRAPAEPADGFFWCAVGSEDPAVPPYRRLDVLVALGLRPGRPGLSIIPVEMELGDERPGHWADAHARADGADFANVLPGGEMQGLYALTTPTEVLKLVSLCFWYIARHPDALSAEAAQPGGSAPERVASAFPYQRVRLLGSTENG